MKKPIRVLCVFSTLDRGGAETMCMNLYRHIDRSKVQFDFVKHTSKEGSFEKEITELGGRIYTAPRFKLYNLISYALWWRHHFKQHPEHHIVHGHFFTISAFYFLVAHRYNRVTIGHVHASCIDGKFRNWAVSLIEKRADYCLACSEQSGNWVYPHKKFYVLKNALDMGLFSFDKSVREQYRNALGIESGCRVLGTVANFSAAKNPFGLLSIFKCLHDKDDSAVLLWVGDGQYRKEIEQKVIEDNLARNVILLGTRTDVPQLLQSMDCFLLPSFNEGLPVSVIEAQASGLPCFISDTVTREVDITGLCTFLPINDEKKWRDHILSYSGVRADTSEYIRRAGYDVHDTAKWLQEFYVKICK